MLFKGPTYSDGQGLGRRPLSRAVTAAANASPTSASCQGQAGQAGDQPQAGADAECPQY
jgi:hypothetical protein